MKNYSRVNKNLLRKFLIFLLLMGNIFERNEIYKYNKSKGEKVSLYVWTLWRMFLLYDFFFTSTNTQSSLDFTLENFSTRICLEKLASEFSLLMLSDLVRHHQFIALCTDQLFVTLQNCCEIMPLIYNWWI